MAVLEFSTSEQTTCLFCIFVQKYQHASTLRFCPAALRVRACAQTCGSFPSLRLAVVEMSSQLGRSEDEIVDKRVRLAAGLGQRGISVVEGRRETSVPWHR
eukprot:190222-Hanusia_phi.AAC.9